MWLEILLVIGFVLLMWWLLHVAESGEQIFRKQCKAFGGNYDEIGNRLICVKGGRAYTYEEIKED